MKKSNSAITVLRWIIGVFLFLTAFAAGMNISGLMLIVAGILCLPIPALREWISRITKGRATRKVKIISVLLLFFFALLLSPSTSSSSVPVDANSASVSSSLAIPASSEASENALAEPVASSTPNEIPPENSELQVHYIDVGQADAIFLSCDGHNMMIDGGNVADSSLVYSYLNKLGVSQLDYVIATHAHEDHVGGLAAILKRCDVGTIYSPVTSYSTKAFSNFNKYVEAQGKTITVPTPGTTFQLGSAQVEIVGPITIDSSDPNNTSIVCRVSHGNNHFLFSGDAEREEEQAILAAGYDLSANVYKVGHHGSDTSSSYPFLREIMPSIAVVSVGKDNSYGHPDDNTLSRLKDAGATVYRTDLHGDIIITSNGTNVDVATEKSGEIQSSYQNDVSQATGNNVGGGGNANAVPPAAVSPETGDGYIGNINSKKLHRPSCSKLPKESNRVYFATRDEAINSGYDPCKICHP